MAAKQYLDYEGLSLYNSLIEEYIGAEDAKSIKYISRVGNTVNFYKNESGTGTADFTIQIPDVSGFMDKIASATGSKVVVSKSDGEVEESAIAIADVATKAYADAAADAKDTAIQAAQDAADAAQGDVDALETLVGTIPAGATATTVVGYAEEVADAVADDLDILDQSLAAVAKSGAASDVSYDNTTSGLTADDVKEAIDELAEASAGGVASKTVYATKTNGGAQDTYAARYTIYQGDEGSAASPVASEKIIDIDVIKDQFVDDSDLVDITYSNGHLYDGTTDVTENIKGAGGTATEADAGKYLKIEFAQPTKKTIYIKLNELIDVYTGGTNAETTTTVDNNNVITVAINEINGSKLAATSVAKGKLAQGVQDSLDLADSAVQAVAEGATNGTIAVDGTDVAVHGLGSAAYTDSSAYEAAGAVTTAIEALDATPSQSAGTDGLALSLTEVDGVVTNIAGSIAANTYDAYGAAATAETNANTYTDNATAGISETDIRALFA